MRPYTFYLHDGVHPVPGFDFVHCRDDEDARAHAAGMLEQFGEYQFIEIYDGQHQRLRIARPLTVVLDEAAA
jgi:hypothetical protein